MNKSYLTVFSSFLTIIAFVHDSKVKRENKETKKWGEKIIRLQQNDILLQYWELLALFTTSAFKKIENLKESKSKSNQIRTRINSIYLHCKLSCLYWDKRKQKRLRKRKD